jgi:FtsH-binding integral membrane protein
MTSIFKANLSDLFKLITTKKEFFIMIFANLIVQLGITYYVMEKINTDPSNKYISSVYRILAFVLILVLVISIVILPLPSWLKFIIFSITSALWGYIFSKLRLVVGEETIKMAVTGAISIFALMFAFGVGLIVSGIKLGFKFGFALFELLTFLIIIRIVQIFIPTTSLIKKIITVFSLLLFSVFIIYDTNSILQRNYNGDFIRASMDYYLDILNIFTDLTSFGRD